MDVQATLYDVATAARAFLHPHWLRWHQIWGPPMPTISSQWTCVRSSLFLVRALHDRGIEACLQSGQPPVPALGVTGVNCGILTAEGWAGHAWVEAEAFIVDITADQFGHAPVVVRPMDVGTYQPAQCEAYRLGPTKAGMAAIDEIWPSWCHHQERCRPPHNGVSPI
jgi:hypothetical protein